MGIDCGMGKTNIDLATGIRYGVISQNSVSGEALSDMEGDYGLPEAEYIECPRCGKGWHDIKGDTVVEWGDTLVCPYCNKDFEVELPDVVDSCGQYLDDGQYKVCDCLDSDLMVILSPYWTYANFCSPCVPGAGNLDSWIDTVPADCRAYCLDSSWFEDGKAPYPVYRVSDNSIVEPE